MIVHVIEYMCTACGECVENCPEVFEMDEDVATVKVDTVPPKFEEACWEVAENCPAECIKIDEE